MGDYIDRVKENAKGLLGGVSDTARVEAEEAVEASAVQLERELQQGSAKLTEAEPPAEQSE